MKDWQYTYNNNPKQGKLIESKKGIKIGRWQNLEEIHNYKDNNHIYSTIQAPDWVLIIPVDKEGFHMIWQYRAAWRRSSLEFPAGKLDLNENIIDGARRELREETGLIAKNMIELGQFRPISWSTQKCYVLIAKNLSKSIQDLDESEDIMNVLIPFNKIQEKIKNNDLTDMPSIAALSLYKQYLN